MNTQYFRYAVEIEKTGSITRAAQNLYMAQPNLSKAIRDLENDLGYEIFKRTPGGIKVTEKGSEFLYHAHKMIEQLDEMEKISRRDEEEIRRFKLSIPRGSYIANGYTEFVADLDMSEGIEITINETNTLQTISNVADRGYHMGIIRYPKANEDYFQKALENNKLVGETIWEFEYVVVMSKQHPLAGKAVLEKQDLEQYVKITHGDILMPDEKSGVKQKENKERKNSRTIYVYERGSQFDLLTKVPTTYMWVSPLPDQYLEQYHLVQRACKVEDNLYKDVLIYRKDYQLTELDILFQKKLYSSKIEVACESVI
ncbi:MAG: LysR family transcriptional regulator [Lachnospiraceae bacterium]